METVVSDRVRKALAQIGRTEDVKFSPDNRRLAIAGFRSERVLLVSVVVDESATGRRVALSDCIAITSPSLHRPHGLFFIDDDTLVVVNRHGAAPIFRLPGFEAEKDSITLAPLQTIRADQSHHVTSPGAVTAHRIGLDLYELLICNTFPHCVTRHILDGRDGFRPIRNEVLLSKELEIPDGIAIDGDLRWIAVSNHNRHGIFMFENVAALNRRSDAAGILGGATFPHGLRFTPDGNFLLAADAGGPYVHIYAKNGVDWKGSRDPIASIRVLDRKTYWWGRDNPKEGGPKGVDVANDMRVMVTSCDQQTLAFFDLEGVLRECGGQVSLPAVDRLAQIGPMPVPMCDRDAMRSRDVLIRELRQLEIADVRLVHQKADLDEAFARQIESIYRSPSWKVSVPVRWVASWWRTLKIKREQVHNRAAKLRKRMLAMTRNS